MYSARWLLLLTAASPLAAQQASALIPITKELRIDGAAEGLTTISSMSIGRDGSIIVGQGQDNQLRFYSPIGKLVNKFGREGAGPGEFQALGKTGWIADTLWVDDARQRRTTFLSAEGKFLRSWKWPTGFRVAAHDSAVRGSLNGLAPNAIYGDGEFLTELFINQNVRPTERLPDPAWYRGSAREYPLVRLNRDGTLLKVVAQLPKAQADACHASFRSGNTAGQVNVPFCAQGLSDVADDGSRIAIILQSDLKNVSASASYRVVVLGARGDTLLSVISKYTPVPVTKRELDSTTAEYRKGTPGPLLDARLAALNTLSAPPTHPPIRAVRVGLDNTIWLSMMTRASVEEWLILDPRGKPLGRVVLPPKTTLRAANRQMIWTIAVDDDDLPSVVRYRVGNQ